MNIENYLESRVDKDFEWYIKYANFYKYLHVSSKILILTASVTITVLTSQNFDEKNLIIAILSALIILISGMSELLKFKEQWKEFRITADTIRSERLLFETKTDPYNANNSFNIYVKNHEMIVREEQKNWRNYITDTK
jgi:uncharacterized membrane protein